MTQKQKAETLEKGLKDLNLTNEELNKFEKAFKDPEFMRLFEEYAKEVSDPKVKAETDMYLRQLEEQGRAEEVYGKGVQLVVPTAALVIKSKVVGPTEAPASNGGAGKEGAGLPLGQKVFINICTSDKVGRYSLKDAKDASGRVGKTLSIPLTLGPVRAGTDKHGKPASVYDFVVHPDSVQFANGNPAAFDSLAETALEHVEKVSRSKLSRSWRRLNIRYKGTEGCTEPPVQSIRTAEGGDAVDGRLRPRADVPAVDVPGAKSAASVAPAAAAAAGAAEGTGKGTVSRSMFSFDRAKDNAKVKVKPQITDPVQPGYRHADGAVTPDWTLVHRGEADLTEAWKDAGRGLALSASVPKELLVRVTMPELASAAAVDLDVGQRVLTLKVPGRYQLSVSLPFGVDEAKGRAKWDKGRKQLEITLPVIPPPPPPRPVAAPSQPTAAETAEVAPREDVEQPAVSGAVQELPGRETEAAASSEDSAQEPAGPQDAMAGSGGVEGAGVEGVGATASGREAADGEGLEAAGSRANGGEASTAAAATGSGRAEEGRQLTENERKWMEIHARDHAEAEVGADAAAAAGADSQSHSGGDAALQDAAPAAQARAPAPAAAAAEEAAPTVLLRPRLQSSLAMELD